MADTPFLDPDGSTQFEPPPTDLAPFEILASAEALRQEASESGAQIEPILENLLHRMRSMSDFPVLSSSVLAIQRMATSETESISSITNEILKDVALTNKLLRLVNSAHYAQSGSISTVSRAVGLVGMHGIRNMTFSLVLLEHMRDKVHAQILKEEYLRGLMAGAIAAELASTHMEGEEAFIAGMFQNLGRMIAQYYFPADAVRVRAMQSQSSPALSEASAAIKVMGLSYEALGVGVARAWGLPATIQRCMTPPSGDPPARAVTELSHRLRWISRAANDMADILLNTEPQVAELQLDVAAKRFCKALDKTSGQVQAAITAAREKVVEMVAAMDLQLPQGARAARLVAGPSASSFSVPGAISQTDFATLSAAELHASFATQPATFDSSPPPPRVNPAKVVQILAAGIQDITNAMVEDTKRSDLVRMILETMYRALNFHRIIFCLRDPKQDAITGRFGLGEGVEGVVRTFNVPMSGAGASNLFTAICVKGADTLISDTSDPRLANRLPAWYRQSFNAPTFLAMPLLIKDKPFGLIYADKATPGGLRVDEKELALLRTLRNQGVMAFKQAS
jgi:eukaryotic-like serine/threonine-protein kinase